MVLEISDHTISQLRYGKQEMSAGATLSSVVLTLAWPFSVQVLQTSLSA